MWACEKGHADVVAELIASGSNVNHQEGGSGFSALMVVAFRGHFEIAKMLLDAGAELGFKNKVWASPQRRCRACASALTRTPTLTCVRSRRCARLRVEPFTCRSLLVAPVSLLSAPFCVTLRLPEPVC